MQAPRAHAFAVFALLLAAALACNLPGRSANGSGGLATSLAQTAQAILTETAGAPTASAASGQPPALANTPVPPPPAGSEPQPSIAPATAPQASDTPVLAASPTNPPPPEACKDDSDFVADITVPDGTEFPSNAAFTKTWRLRNSGNCTWGAGYLYVRISGPEMGAPPSVALPAVVKPGEDINISVNLVAPADAGTYRSRWQLQQPGGERFGTRPFVEIVVK